MIALCHPGKYGDALYSWTLARHLWQTTGQQVAFITSEYCAKLERLARVQEWCGDFIVSKDYVLHDWGCGGQPPDVPVPELGRYTRIIQAGFRTTPDCYLGDWIAKQAGVADGLPLPVSYDLGQRDVWPNMPEADVWSRPLPLHYGVEHPFIVLASRGQTTFVDLFREFARICPIQVVEVGGPGDRICDNSLDATGLDFLLTASIISESRGFVGLMSSQLVLANGFPIKRIAVHNGINWDMRHPLKSELNLYPVDPTAKELVDMLGL